jgi:hypothetical protein
METRNKRMLIIAAIFGILILIRMFFSSGSSMGTIYISLPSPSCIVEIGEQKQITIQLTRKFPLDPNVVTIDVSGFPKDTTIGWSTTAGKIIPHGLSAIFTAPSFSGKALITINFLDASGRNIHTEKMECLVTLPAAAPPLQSAFDEIDKQFDNLSKANLAFNKPEQMKKDETASVELILSQSLSESVLATQVVERGNFVTSTAESNVLISPNGETVTVTTSQIEITPRMKAVLLSQDPEAFTVTEMHDNAEQVVSSVETTAWRWSVTAKKEGSQTLELVIYQLVKYDGKEFWHEVETYEANIVVEVTLGDRVKSLDWYWIAGFIVTLVGAVLGVLKWLDERKKKAAESKPSAPVRRKK